MNRFGKILLGLAALLTCSSAFADPITIAVGVMEIASAAEMGSAIITGVMYAAGALSIVGGLTQNKSLERIGGYLGMAGGVASLASNLASASTTLATQEGGATVAASSEIAAAPATTALGEQAGNTAISDLNTGVNAAVDPAAAQSVNANLAAQQGVSGVADAAPAGGGAIAGPNVMTGSGAGTTSFADPSAVTPPGIDFTGAPAGDSGGLIQNASSAPASSSDSFTPNDTSGGANTSTGSGSGTTTYSPSPSIPGVQDGPTVAKDSFWKGLVDNPSGWIDKNKAVIDVAGKFGSAAMQQLAPSGKDRAALMEAQLQRDKFNYEKQRVANYNKSVQGAAGSHIGFDPNSNPYGGPTFDPTRFVPNPNALQMGAWRPNTPPPGIIAGAQG